MRFRPLLVPVGLLFTAGCASTSPVPAGLAAGKFVSFDCDGQDFQARYNVEGNTVRVRTHHGSAELNAAPGAYQGEGFTLFTGGPNGMALDHNGKLLARNCRPVS